MDPKSQVDRERPVGPENYVDWESPVGAENQVGPKDHIETSVIECSGIQAGDDVVNTDRREFEMETAKVDIRKLQTLNDCINRTIEALNQVRLSVHGAGPQGFGMVPGIGGIAHAAAGGYYPQFSQFPQVGSYGPAAAQYAAQYAASPYASLGAMSPLAYWSQQGLGHTAGASAYDYADPYATARISQTFPFVHWGYSPFGWPAG